MARQIKVQIPVDAQQDAEFDRAFELLRDLVDWSAADREFPVRGNAVYTTSVVLWMLVSQRMHPERSLESAAKRLLETQPEILPRNQRVLERTLSNRTGGYSRATRQVSAIGLVPIIRRKSSIPSHRWLAPFRSKRVPLGVSPGCSPTS